jgi:hypothetical protein
MEINFVCCYLFGGIFDLKTLHLTDSDRLFSGITCSAPHCGHFLARPGFFTADIKTPMLTPHLKENDK